MQYTTADLRAACAEYSTSVRLDNLLLWAAATIEAQDLALREIAVGMIGEDSIAEYHHRYLMCATRLCQIARAALAHREVPK